MFLCTIPALILYKGIVTPQIHGHLTTTFRAMRNQFRWNTHILLFFHHPANEFFIIVSFLMTWLRALQKSIVSLCVKKPLFIKSGFLKTVIYIRGNYKIVLILHQMKQIFIYRPWHIHISVIVNMSALPCPITHFIA